MRLLLALSLAAAGATLPRKITFQGRLTDPATGNPRNGTFNMTFRIYDAATGGTALYTEGPRAVAVNNGVFSVQIGSTTALQPELFRSASAYLGITVAGDSEMVPRQQLTMSAYAFTASQLVRSGDVPIQAGNAVSTFTASGTLQAPAFDGDGAELRNVRPRISSAALSSLLTMTANVETVVLSTSIAPSRDTSQVMLWSTLGLNRAVNSLSTWQLRVRRNVGSACDTASTQVGITNSHTVQNSAGVSQLVPVLAVDQPATTSTVFYCVTAQVGAAQTLDERKIVVMEVQP